MAEKPIQKPRRPKGFFEGALLDWRIAAIRNELTDQELVTCAAQFLGLAIASMDLAVEHQIEMLTAAAKVAHDTSLARTAVKQGSAWPVQTNIRGPGLRS